MSGRSRGSIPAAAALVAAACVAVVLGAAWRARPSDQQQIVRLLDGCLAGGGAAFQFTTGPLPAGVSAAPTPINHWKFDGRKTGWLLLDEQWRRVADSDPTVSWRPVRAKEGDDASDDVLRFPVGRGALALVVPATAKRLLRVTARVRRAPPVQSLDSRQAALQALLLIQPLQQPVDLGRELAQRGYVALVNDPRVRVSKDDLWASATAPASGKFETISLTFLTPGSTQALLLQFGAGDGSAGAPVDLAEITLEEWPLRGFLGLGTAPFAPTASATVAPFDRRELPLLPPPDETRPALRKVDDLLERRDALVLPAPARTTIEVDLPPGDLVLEYGITRVHEPRKSWSRAPIEVSVTAQALDAGGRTVVALETLAAGGPTGWQERTLALGELAGRRVRFTFAADTKRSPDLVAVGAPLVRRRAPRDPRRNVIVVSLDTVRADHWSCHGYPRPTTPCLDQLAQESAWFRDASSTSSYTVTAHGSLFTGQLPSRHGAESAMPGRNRLFSDRSDLLALRLRDEGWLTAAFTGGVYLNASFGFDQGFDRYDTTDLALEPDDPRALRTPVDGDRAFNSRHRADRPIDTAFEWIRAHADSRFLLFLHTYVVHDYLADARNEARFHGSCASPLARGDLSFIRDRTITTPPTAAELDHYVDAYDAALRQADELVGRLVATLRDLGLAESTVLVVTSDHGEEFGDHGGVAHGRTLHDEVVRVPLLLRAPGFAPREIAEPVSLVDVTPTLLDLLGFAPQHEVDGRSLVPLLRGETLAPAVLEAELNLDAGSRWSMRRAGASKALGIFDDRGAKRLAALEPPQEPRRPRRLVFAPALDPGERRDLAGGTPEEQSLAAELQDALDAQRDRMRERRAAAKRDAAGLHPSGDRFDLARGGYVVAPGEEDDE